MPRQARLDDPGTLHHVMIRGIEGKSIFRDSHDRLNRIPDGYGKKIRGLHLRYRQGYSENGDQNLKVHNFHYVPHFRPPFCFSWEIFVDRL